MTGQEPCSMTIAASFGRLARLPTGLAILVIAALSAASWAAVVLLVVSPRVAIGAA